ncbi:hypothetical protein KRR26_28315 [Corallococcus sp. M34]|uniref:hypothetical protein n=1 Tax=Citreicoccus inhibens TaxID=2849499 RepID=UPI0018F4810A|nr:hypothetical protein [Citreicoccus inhibens]MBU8899527.1 hypothetical protein [Citreicoccus inhibens]
MNRLPVLVLALLLGGACAHTSKKTDLENLKPTVEAFHENIRWRNFRNVSRILVPERRDAFERSRREHQDDRDLTITDYEIEDVKVSDDGQRATVRSTIQWMRLPSASAHTDTVTSEFIFRDGAWLLERQESGPFEGELP